MGNLLKMSFLPQWAKQSGQHNYFPVSSRGSETTSKEALLEETESNSSFNREFSTAARKPKVAWILYLSIFFNVILGLLAVSLSAPRLQQYFADVGTNNTIIKSVSMPSPILDQIHVELRTQRRNGSLLPNHPSSLYRQDPSDEVDAAWNRLTNINPIHMSAKDVENIGYDPAKVARWPAEYGLGDDAYIGRLDVFHELHCLNMLRQEIHFDYYYSERWTSPQTASPDHKIHISHCIYALLQSLMCASNTDPFIHYWVDVGEEPYPDFSINKQCRDFESVLKWQEENSIPMGQFRDVIRKPENAAPRIMSLEYKYMVGLITQDPALNWTAAAAEIFESQ